MPWLKFDYSHQKWLEKYRVVTDRLVWRYALVVKWMDYPCVSDHAILYAIRENNRDMVQHLVEKRDRFEMATDQK